MSHTATMPHLYAGWVEEDDGTQRPVHAHLHCVMARYASFEMNVLDPVSQGMACDLCRASVYADKEASDLAHSAE